MTPKRFTLSAGSLELDVLPAIGGSIARFDTLGPTGRQPLLRGTDSDYTDVLESACFPLVPFVNRIRQGQFECGHQTIRLARNLPGDASPLHGQGWRAAWTVESLQDDQMELVYQHDPGEWPWAYESRQRITLSPEGLSIELSCINRSAAPMPCGLGLHPYYPCTKETRLDTDVVSVWTVDANVLPVANLPAIGPYSLQNRLICGQGLDNGFDGWGGTARITWPASAMGLQLSCADAPYFQVYSPAGRGFFAAEPVQHANAALNAPQVQWRQLGIRMLARGERRRLVARFTVFQKSNQG
ncbi:MAG: aldose 1-epimerase [Polaromonas sp.]|nr:aldose 1-epimerase [Polaromonas sp.]